MPTPTREEIDTNLLSNDPEIKGEIISRAMEKIMAAIGGNVGFSPVVIEDVLAEMIQARANADIAVPSLYRGVPE